MVCFRYIIVHTLHTDGNKDDDDDDDDNNVLRKEENIA